ncbi:hypothetical protein [Mammaliicoccus sp. Dog046]|uniref:hypothetical protein n=1 Tax=Mammaliicoccus sp. Dog046 TaxID=3034233 RepID=UPI002B259E3D|nr:hypothetical protein [Mammaliicoccus sp. Dog046]WQK84771.1 hypothetical protein P3U32_09030 [Mammaliicoccus sp. Dog046]
MIFNSEYVHNYLNLINDQNPVHDEVVPGQLVCEWLLLGIEWPSYTIQYKKSIYMGEKLFKDIQKDHIKCVNEYGELKITIKKA